MMTRRPYSEPLTSSAALREIERCAGSQFDPDVVREFIAVVTERERRSEVLRFARSA